LLQRLIIVSIPVQSVKFFGSNGNDRDNKPSDDIIPVTAW